MLVLLIAQGDDSLPVVPRLVNSDVNDDRTRHQRPLLSISDSISRSADSSRA